MGLSRDHGSGATCRRHRREDGAPAGDLAVRRRVGRILVGADEASALAHGGAGHGQALIVEVAVPADDDGVGVALAHRAHAPVGQGLLDAGPATDQGGPA